MRRGRPAGGPGAHLLLLTPGPPGCGRGFRVKRLVFPPLCAQNSGVWDL